MKVFIDVTRTWESFALTGIQRVAIEYLRALRETLGSKNVVATRVNKRGLWALNEKQVQKLLLLGQKDKPRGKRGRRWRWNGLQQKIVAPKNEKIDGVLFAPEVFPAELAKHLTKFQKTVALVHDVFARDQKAFRRYINIVSRFHARIVPSRYTKIELEEFFGEVSTVVEHGVSVLPPINKKVLNNSKTSKSQEKILFCIGSLEERKNHLALLQACERLWKEGEDFSLVIAGIKTKSGLRAAKKIKELKKAGQKISWLGAISDEKAFEILSTSWAFVYPSSEEGFGLPVAEALSLGIPVICGTGGALRERVRVGGCEVLKQNDVSSIADAIRNILNTSHRQKLADEARALPVRSWNTAAKEFLSVIASIKEK